MKMKKVKRCCGNCRSTMKDDDGHIWYAIIDDPEMEACTYWKKKYTRRKTK